MCGSMQITHYATTPSTKAEAKGHFAPNHTAVLFIVHVLLSNFILAMEELKSV